MIKDWKKKKNLIRRRGRIERKILLIRNPSTFCGITKASYTEFMSNMSCADIICLKLSICKCYKRDFTKFVTEKEKYTKKIVKIVYIFIRFIFSLENWYKSTSYRTLFISHHSICVLLLYTMYDYLVDMTEFQVTNGMKNENH